MLSRRALMPSRLAGHCFRYVTITPITMPAMSPTMEQGGLSEWCKQVGDELAVGQVFCKVETDKAVLDVENQSEEGFFARHLIPAGTKNVKVGTPIALLVEESGDIGSDEVKNWTPEGDASSAAAPAATEAAAPAAAASTSSSSSGSGAERGSGDRVFASPLAKTIAAKLGVPLAAVKGTGGSVGRVTADDVIFASKNLSKDELSASAPAAAAAAPAAAEDRAAPQQSQAQTQQADAPRAATRASAPPPPPAPTGAAYEDIEVSSMRRVIAERLTQSKNVDVPHYYETVDCVADNMKTTIKHLNEKGAGKYKISVNDYIIKALARANKIVPECNTHWHGDIMRRYASVDVSVAVATDNGLITPIIRNADTKGLVEISQEMKELAKRAREGGLKPHEYQGGTATVSNLGGMGITNFTAIINPPQSMILAVGNSNPRPKFVLKDDGEYEFTGQAETVIKFTASFDHRVVDGAVGAAWFKHFKDAIENPLSFLL